jgi:3'(2'), 5'-bisphosphate nucleotidase
MDNLADHGLVLADIVDEASELVLPFWRSELVVDAKADESPVTEADRQAEALILARLADLFPGTPVVSEEHAAVFGTPQAVGPRFFLVDPIDGTRAFVRGDRYFTVNIALVQHGRVVAGAIGAPALGQTWFTARGGAWRRGPEADAAPIHARRWRSGEATAVLSHTIREDAADALAAEYGFSRRRGVDSSYKLCLVAQGDADIYPRHGPTMEWDIAAGHAIVEAAGGTVLNYDGSPLIYGKADEGFRNGWFVARGVPQE